MIVVCSDTHSREGHALTGRTLEAVREAELVIHAGDFVTASALEAFESVAAALVAVHGNADHPAVKRRLPRVETVDVEGVRILVTHRSRGGDTGLAMLGRENGADIVVSGHTHRPRVSRVGAPPGAGGAAGAKGTAGGKRAGGTETEAVEGTAGTGGLVLLNPGSHADPRGHRPGHAELTPSDEGLAGTLRSPDGTVHERVTIRR